MNAPRRRLSVINRLDGGMSDSSQVAAAEQPRNAGLHRHRVHVRKVIVVQLQRIQCFDHCIRTDKHSKCSPVCLIGYTLVSINVVTPRQTRLVPRMVTVFGRVNHLGAEIRIFGLIRIRIWMSAGSLQDLSIHCLVGFSHFAECRENRLVTMRNVNKSKIPYSEMAREREKWSRIRIRDRIVTKSQSVLPIGRPNHNTKFRWNRLITFCSNLANRQNDRQIGYEPATELHE